MRWFFLFFLNPVPSGRFQVSIRIIQKDKAQMEKHNVSQTDAPVRKNKGKKTVHSVYEDMH